MTAVRADVAAMLRAGATHAEIMRECGVSSHTVVRTRNILRIPVPPERAKRSRAEIAAAEEQAVAMLRAGTPQREIHRQLRVGLNRIAELRRQHQIPIPRHDRLRLTVDESYALYALPTTGGHVMWTGPRSGRGVELIASGRTYNARAVAFEKHHGREPDGRLRRTCDQPDCIAGAHYTDHRIRQAHKRADRAFASIFGHAP